MGVESFFHPDDFSMKTNTTKGRGSEAPPFC
jgi:hypothetical protein